MGSQINLVCVVLVSSAMGLLQRVHSAEFRYPRAIGGSPIEDGSKPWLVLLKADIVKTQFLGIPVSHRHIFCGGSVLNNHWVLTAAHCFLEFGPGSDDPSNWEVRLASADMEPSVRERMLHLIGTLFNERDWLQWDIGVDRIVVHPQYNQSNIWSNDIALLKLKDEVPSGPDFSNIRVLHLPPKNDSGFPTEGMSCNLSGWGCTSNGGGPSPVAREIIMPVYSSARCRQHYNVTMRNRLCAGYRNRGVGVCAGDSGSSLVCKYGGRDVVTGVVSFTSRDRPGGFPAVFTSVSQYVDWINSIIW